MPLRSSRSRRDTPLEALRKLYARVARQTGLKEAFIISVALGEQKSDIVEAALEEELRKIARLLRRSEKSGNLKILQFRRYRP
jgi:hypothetical protein